MPKSKTYLDRNINGLKQAAEAGVREAQLELGSWYYRGDGDSIEQSYEKSLYWFEQAAKQGAVEAQFLMGGFYELGIPPLTQNAIKAVYWYTQAAQQLYPAALSALAMCYLHGFGKRKNAAEAAQYLQLASQGGDADAQYELASCFEKGVGLPKNSRKAVQWYTTAAEQGDSRAMYELGRYYLSRKRKVKDKARYWLENAAIRGHAQAAEMLHQLDNHERH